MEVETDKVTVEIEAPADGLLAGVRAPEGAEVPVGETVAVIVASGEEVPTNGSGAAGPAVEASPAAPVEAVATRAPAGISRRRLASPKARRLAAERGIDLDSLVPGSGPHGALVAADILAASEGGDGEPAELGAGEELAPSRIWSIMAERTTRSWTTAPHFYLLREVDAGRLASWRDVARERLGRSVSVTDLLVRATAAALRDHPRVNAAWVDGSIRVNAEVNVGIAVAVDDGLLVPVIHGADRLGLLGIADAARGGRRPRPRGSAPPRRTSTGARSRSRTSACTGSTLSTPWSTRRRRRSSPSGASSTGSSRSAACPSSGRRWR